MNKDKRVKVWACCCTECNECREKVRSVVRAYIEEHGSKISAKPNVRRSPWYRDVPWDEVKGRFVVREDGEVLELILPSVPLTKFAAKRGVNERQIRSNSTGRVYRLARYGDATQCTAFSGDFLPEGSNDN